MKGNHNDNYTGPLLLKIAENTKMKLLDRVCNRFHKSWVLSKDGISYLMKIAINNVNM